MESNNNNKIETYLILSEYCIEYLIPILLYIQ